MPELLLGPHSPRNTVLYAQVVMRVGINTPTPDEGLVFREIHLGQLQGALNIGEHEGNAVAFQRDVVDLAIKWRRALAEQWPVETLTALLADLTCLSEITFDAVPPLEPSSSPGNVAL